jgi:hypothetical protein
MMSKVEETKKAVKKIIDDGHYIQVIEGVDFLPVYKGKDFDKAWKAIEEYFSVSVEVYRNTKIYIGYVFIEDEKMFNYSGNYVESVFEKAS